MLARPRYPLDLPAVLDGFPHRGREEARPRGFSSQLYYSTPVSAFFKPREQTGSDQGSFPQEMDEVVENGAEKNQENAGEGTYSEPNPVDSRPHACGRTNNVLNSCFLFSHSFMPSEKHPRRI